MRHLLVLALLVGFSHVAFAHKMDVVARIPAETPSLIRVEVGYDTDEPTEKATVTIRRADVPAILTMSTTDEKGVCTLPRPKAGRYVIRAEDGAGHSTEVTLEVPDSETELAEAHSEKRTKTLMAVTGLATIAVVTVGLAIAARTLGRKRRAE